MRYLLAHFLALALIAGLITISSGAFRRAWPRMIAGAGVVGMALGIGYWIF